MQITIPLSPERQAELERRAAAEGVDLPHFILDAVQEKLDERGEPSAEGVPYEQWSSEFRSWVASHRSRNPRFDDSREGIYD